MLKRGGGPYQLQQMSLPHGTRANDRTTSKRRVKVYSFLFELQFPDTLCRLLLLMLIIACSDVKVAWNAENVVDLENKLIKTCLNKTYSMAYASNVSDILSMQNGMKRSVLH
jgi:hypothetical protein